jgi:hypothetical protein
MRLISKLNISRRVALALGFAAPVAADPFSDALADAVRAQLGDDYATGARLSLPFP